MRLTEGRTYVLREQLHLWKPGDCAGPHRIVARVNEQGWLEVRKLTWTERLVRWFREKS